MKFWHHRYRLPREGALIKVDFGNAIGYADCHPWPELGDEPLEVQLQNISPRVIAMAKFDAEARKNKRSLFQNLTIPESHYFLANHEQDLNEIKQRGFQRVKVKRPSLELLRRLPVGMLWRLDFNQSLQAEEFEDFLEQAPLDKIEFIEDPTVYEPSLWKSWNRRVALACDRRAQEALSFPDSQKFLVVKPAVVDPKIFLGRNFLITSYLDHPVGQMGAAFAAAKYCPNKICGLMSHTAYPPNLFSAQFITEGARLKPPQGIGLGFDTLLQELSWTPC